MIAQRMQLLILTGMALLAWTAAPAAQKTNAPEPPPDEIVLVPQGAVDPAVLAFLKSELPAEFHRAVTIADARPLPPDALDAKRKQYNSSKILEDLFYARQRLNERWLAVTDVDLFVPTLNFVFGEADSDHRLAVISLARLNPKFYHQKPDPALLHWRALKEAVHELGHTYGLGHCSDVHCVMFFSNSLYDTDRKSANFCEKHRKELDEKLK